MENDWIASDVRRLLYGRLCSTRVWSFQLSILDYQPQHLHRQPSYDIPLPVSLLYDHVKSVLIFEIQSIARTRKLSRSGTSTVLRPVLCSVSTQQDHVPVRRFGCRC